MKQIKDGAITVSAIQRRHRRMRRTAASA